MMSRSTNDPAVIGVALALNFVGPSTFLVLPLLVDGAVHTLGFSYRQVGMMSFAVSTGGFASAILAGFWVRWLSWPRATLISLTGMVAANSLSLVLHEYWLIALLQGAAGFFGGSLGCLAMTVLSDSKSPARHFGYAMAIQVTYQVACILAGPMLLRLAGLNGVFTMLAIVSALAMPLALFLPANGRAVPSAGIPTALIKPATLLALLGCTAFFFNVGCYWTYIEIIGADHGLSSRVVANCIAAGVAAGIPGGLLASAMGERFGRLRPLVIAAVMTMVAVLLLTGAVGPATFVVSGLLYNFAWNYSLSYQLDAVNWVDATGRVVAIAGAFYNAGSAGGAAIAALLVRPHDYTAVVFLVIVSVALSSVLFGFSAAAHRRVMLRLA
jgi:predicted MFS family arabinose efflux permease